MNVINFRFSSPNKVKSIFNLSRIFRLWGIITGIVIMTACGRITPHSRTVEEIRVLLEPDDYKTVSYVQGEDCVGRYLIFFRFSSPNIVNAAKGAMSNAPQANFLVNRHVGVQEKLIVPLLYHQLCVQIEGRAIQLLTADGDIL